MKRYAHSLYYINQHFFVTLQPKSNDKIIMKVKVNDIVRFLNDVGGGRVTRIDGKNVYVEDEDGFERPALERDLVVVGQAGTKASAYERCPQTQSGA